jgi:hypothetical protein
MSHNLVTEIKKQLTPSKIGTGITFLQDTTWNITMILSFPLAMLDLSQLLHKTLHAIWRSAQIAIRKGKSLQVQQALLSDLGTNPALCWTKEAICI